ncbi:MAG: hypothetical protein U0491_00840 [Candidatus Saccharimonadales bacterium]
MTNPERTVLIDMDGTIADFDGTLTADLRAEYPEIEIPPRKSFYFEDDFAKADRDAIQTIISRPGFFLRHGVITGAIEGWQGLLEAGYEPRICTAPLRKNRFSIPDKIGWLEEHMVPVFGPQIIDKAIIDKHKYKHPGLALIDDRDEIENVNRASWEHIVFDQPYNHECKAQYRMLGWHDKGVFVALGSIANRAA